jgi:predicted Zn-dependent protease
VDINSLKKMIDSGRDSAMLRLTLARVLLQQGETPEAILHLEAAVRMDTAYTAGWKELGKARQISGDKAGAGEAWTSGIECARKNGDKQAEKEMNVFIRRLERDSRPG